MSATVTPYTSKNSESYLQHRENNILKPVNDFADSFGLKPFKIDFVSYEDVKNALSISTRKTLPSASTARFILFSVYTKISNSQVNEFIDRIIRTKQSSASTLIHFRKYLNEHINKTDADGQSWAYRQTLTAIENLVNNNDVSKTRIQVIREFDHKKINRVFVLDEQGLNSVAIAGVYPQDNQEILLDLGTHYRETPKYQYV